MEATIVIHCDDTSNPVYTVTINGVELGTTFDRLEVNQIKISEDGLQTPVEERCTFTLKR